MVVLVLIWLAVLLQRLGEVRQAGANTQRLLAQGAIEYAPRHYPLMVALHGGWLLSWLGECLWQGPQWQVGWLAPALAGQLLRGWTRASLGSRWTTRILVLPGEVPQAQGPFVWLRHPNYLGVVLELLALPWLFGAWRTALIFSLLNAALLAWRIPQEEKAWKTFGA